MTFFSHHVHPLLSRFYLLGARGCQIIFHKPLFCKIFSLSTFLFVLTPVSSFTIIFSSSKGGPNSIAKTDWVAMHGRISPPGSATEHYSDYTVVQCVVLHKDSQWQSFLCS